MVMKKYGGGSCFLVKKEENVVVTSGVYIVI